MSDKSSLPGEGMRKITKELMEISKNAVFVGGVKYLSDKNGYSMLLCFYFFVSAIFIAHVNSYIQGISFSSAIHKNLV
ncbi:hypothetical protein [Methylobacterium nonmethylotrophicum]|uniref:Uncharacterized protein n=1 Tax=Methylobacterium nonmethylotrophicum TaxID=1141884 RepID=A0A4Z0NCQ5_9HYPH|nr:hypothetical protein [Methylobacterium nonmethylotrophicum]TGD91283.1 hypothetical protein EU555_35905 [Methylobacterium nonmethylotrophicum]